MDIFAFMEHVKVFEIHGSSKDESSIEHAQNHYKKHFVDTIFIFIDSGI